MNNIKCNECEEVDCDCDWYEIYNHESFEDYCGEHAHLQPYRNYDYYQCWGGGPEGGFIVSENGCKVFKVNRGWGEPFSVEPIDGELVLEERHGVMQLRIIKN